MSMPNTNTADHPILLFDGVCNLCDGFVQFILKRDKEAVFRFTSLQSEIAETLLQEHRYDQNDLSTVILIENGKVYTNSDVALRVARRLGGAWSWCYYLSIIPRPIRDFVYRIIANNRYRLFGKKNSCFMPSPQWQERFLDN